MYPLETFVVFDCPCFCICVFVWHECVLKLLKIFHLCFGHLHTFSEVAVQWALSAIIHTVSQTVQMEFVRTLQQIYEMQNPASHKSESFLAHKWSYNCWSKHCEICYWWFHRGDCVINGWRQVVAWNRAGLLFKIAWLSDRERRTDCACCWQVSHE